MASVQHADDDDPTAGFEWSVEEAETYFPTPAASAEPPMSTNEVLSDSGIVASQAKTEAELQRAHCLEMFKTKDAIMEPSFLEYLRLYFDVGGDPTEAVPVIAQSYEGVAQSANLLIEWLLQIDEEQITIAHIVESCLEELIEENFDPEKVDPLMLVGEDEQQWQWLLELIRFPRWRQMIYKLSARYPDSGFLICLVRMMSQNAEYQDDLATGVPSDSAVYQLEVFTNLFKSTLGSALASSANRGDIDAQLEKLVSVCCLGEHTYLLSTSLLASVIDDTQGGNNLVLLWQLISERALAANRDVIHHELQSRLTGHLSSATSTSADTLPALQSLRSMLSKGTLYPADVTALYNYYSAEVPPPVVLLRCRKLVDQLISRIFCLTDGKMQQEHQARFFYLLAYASSVSETWSSAAIGGGRGGTRGGQPGRRRLSIDKSELHATIEAIETAHAICSSIRTPNELLVELVVLCQAIRTPVVAVGIARWIEKWLSDGSSDLFQLSPQSIGVHLTILDEIVTRHMSLHDAIHKLLVRLLQLEVSDMEVLGAIELRKRYIERLVHLMSVGYVIPVLETMRRLWSTQSIDISLVRHFAFELLDMIKPPISKEFAQLFQPMVADAKVIGNDAAVPAVGVDPARLNCANQFLLYCRKTFGLSSYQ